MLIHASSHALINPEISISLQKSHPYTGNSNGETSGVKPVSTLWRCFSSELCAKHLPSMMHAQT